MDEGGITATDAGYEETMHAILKSARHQLLLLAIGVQSGDQDGASVALSCLEWGLLLADELLGRAPPSRTARWRADLDKVRGTADRWMARARRPRLTPEELERLIARAVADVEEPGHAIIANRTALDDLDLDGLALLRFRASNSVLERISAQQACLDFSDLKEATLTNCKLAAVKIRDSHLERAYIRDCNFANADLDRASLAGAKVEHCDFTGARLVDVSLDGAEFTACSFLNATFTATKSERSGGTASAKLVRCDLRYSNWTHRTLVGMTLRACKMYGAYGDMSAIEEPDIIRPDLSRTGDGSRVGDQLSAIAEWRSRRTLN